MKLPYPKPLTDFGEGNHLLFPKFGERIGMAVRAVTNSLGSLCVPETKTHNSPKKTTKPNKEKRLSDCKSNYLEFKPMVQLPYGMMPRKWLLRVWKI